MRIFMKLRTLLLMTVVSCLMLGAMIPNQAAGGPTVQDFDNPGTTYTLTNFTGDPASLESGGPTGNFIRLAHETNDNLNTIAFDLTAPGFNLTVPAPGTYLRIIADFDFRISNGDADGFGFVLLNTGNFGTTGAGPQMSEEPSLASSFGVGFDIFYNSENDDPNDNHISLHFDGNRLAAFAMDPNTFNLKDGSFHHARVTVDFVSGGARVNVNFDDSFTPIGPYFISGMTPYESRVAFGARTGGLWADHDLDNINVQFTTFTPQPPIGSISGRIVDASTSTPLSGTGEPFAHAYLYRCDLGCGQVNDQFAGSDGQFTFTSDSSGLLLEVGTYRVEASANGYFTGQTGIFSVGQGENHDVGDVPLEVYVPLTINVTVDPNGTVVSKTGVATIYGTATCTQNANIHVNGNLKEKVGRSVAIGDFDTGYFTCDGQTPWSATVESYTSLIFGAGSAEVQGYADGCSVFECAYTEYSGKVSLKGKKK